MPSARDAAEPGPPAPSGADEEDYGPPSSWDFCLPHPVGRGDIVEMPADVQASA
jgi:hypothetical protein